MPGIRRRLLLAAETNFSVMSKTMTPSAGAEMAVCWSRAIGPGSIVSLDMSCRGRNVRLRTAYCDLAPRRSRGIATAHLRTCRLCFPPWQQIWLPPGWESKVVPGGVRRGDGRRLGTMGSWRVRSCLVGAGGLHSTTPLSATDEEITAGTGCPASHRTMWTSQH